MADKDTLVDHLERQGISRRTFLKFCSLTASSLALPTVAARAIAQTLSTTPRPTVIWLSGQECTGCSESILRSFDPTIESLILSEISLDYHNTLMAPSGTAAELSRETAIAQGGHVVVVDGSIPLNDNGAWSIIGGRAVLDVVQESVASAGLIIAIGNCAAFGGIPKAEPNPTAARGVDDLIQGGQLATSAPLVNLPGCPPIPEVITGVIVHFLTFGLPELDALKRPTAFFGTTVHDSCTRKDAFNGTGQFAQSDGTPLPPEQRFAASFDDDVARRGGCLLNLGCRGTVTNNACTTIKWNGGTSFPMLSGHGCLGCSEPDFWDRISSVTGGKGFYAPVFKV